MKSGPTQSTIRCVNGSLTIWLQWHRLDILDSAYLSAGTHDSFNICRHIPLETRNASICLSTFSEHQNAYTHHVPLSEQNLTGTTTWKASLLMLSSPTGTHFLYKDSLCKEYALAGILISLRQAKQAQIFFSGRRHYVCICNTSLFESVKESSDKNWTSKTTSTLLLLGAMSVLDLAMSRVTKQTTISCQQSWAYANSHLN